MLLGIAYSRAARKPDASKAFDGVKALNTPRSRGSGSSRSADLRATSAIDEKKGPGDSSPGPFFVAKVIRRRATYGLLVVPCGVVAGAVASATAPCERVSRYSFHRRESSARRASLTASNACAAPASSWARASAMPSSAFASSVSLTPPFAPVPA
jgi:hypothetical protein